jgi:selenocysteine-specific elongation factor
MLTLGTAGHIDHGKTTLTGLLTGQQTDRLPEEKRRGISIELGFARLDTASGASVGLVDVPGHERFVHTMVAGAAGIQGYLLVLAADEGIMPQTREHLAVLRLLGVSQGVVALSKTDLAEEGWPELVADEVRELLASEEMPEAEVVPYSSKDPASVEAVRAAIDRLLPRLDPPPERGLFRLPIDRVFTLKGHGTVVTGTLAAGRVEVGQEVVFYPGEHRSRVRAIQTFGESREFARGGERASLNVPDVGTQDLARGAVAVRPDTLGPTSVIDVRMELLRELPEAFRKLKSGTRVRVHVGTASATGRVHLLGQRHLDQGARALAQLRLDEPLVAAPGDRLLLRAVSPVLTVGGGAVLEVDSPRYKRGSAVVTRLERIEAEGAPGLVRARLESTPHLLENVAGLSRALLLSEKEVRAALKDLGGVISRRDGSGGPYYGDPGRLERAERLLEAEVDRVHAEHPEEAGVPRDALGEAGGMGLEPVVVAALMAELAKRGAVVEAGGRVARPGHTRSVDHDLAGARQAILDFLADDEVPFHGVVNLAEAADLPEAQAVKALEAMVKAGDLKRVPGPLYAPAERLAELRGKVLAILDERKPQAVPTKDFKAALELPRKALIPLLEGMDEDAMTLRAGEGRIRKPGYKGDGG